MSDAVPEMKLVSENPQSTVVAEFTPTKRDSRAYQSEAALEEAFIQQLEAQQYGRVAFADEASLIGNLRLQLEKLNQTSFSDAEWQQLFNGVIANKTNGIVEKTRLIQEDYIQVLHRDDGSEKNIYLLDKKDIHNNTLQVMHQYATAGGKHRNRYDVTVLVNGLPLVHIELKRRGVSLEEAFNQINRYQNESFAADNGLFEFVQIFVISNGTLTKYYSNSTRENVLKENLQQKTQKKSNSFEFTSWWTDEKNNLIRDLMDFAQTFFSRHSLLNVLTKYCVFTSEDILMVMRPYQIVAAEKIINQIQKGHFAKTYGSVNAGGYVWHTTGSGKTLTSFKTAQLACQLPEIHKVLFVVDRKDLDYQTMKEYDRFAKGAANSNTSTRILTQQMENPNAKIIITTIQKLAVFIKQNKSHAVYGKELVIIFDECHRSQFGDMHEAITKAFKKYYLFGFTGTPIFARNANSSGKAHLRTTEQAFGKKLHVYSIVNAIADGNVLPFKLSYHATFREKEHVEDKEVVDIDREKALNDPRRISKVTQYILQTFADKTRRADSYQHHLLVNVAQTAKAKHRSKVAEKTELRYVKGFNSIFAVASIASAKQYYLEFQRQQAAFTPDNRLKVAVIFSYGVNDGENDGLDDENNENTAQLSTTDREFLDDAIGDYNAQFHTNYDTSGDKFQSYYKDVSLRMKNREIDLLIVVNMFLTGFDATTLNTLWVDKNLRWHGLLQAFSRTNRILNAVKDHGNIVCFRNLEKATNEALALFGDENAAGIVLLKPYRDYYEGYADEDGKEIPGYRALIETVMAQFPAEKRILGEAAEKNFITLWGNILRLKNVLNTFDEFAGNEILQIGEFQDYQSIYMDLYQKYRGKKERPEEINDDLVFEIELIKQVDINIDYILQLIAKYHEEHTDNKEINVAIRKSIDASPALRDKKSLIEAFVDKLTPNSDIDADWPRFVAEKKDEELESIIVQEQLKPEATRTFIKRAFEEGELRDTGTDFARILPNIPRFKPDSHRAEKRASVVEKLQTFFSRFTSV